MSNRIQPQSETRASRPQPRHSVTDSDCALCFSAKLRKRSRLRAKDQSLIKLQQLRSEFHALNSTEEVGRNNSMPRPEIVDALLMRLEAHLATVTDRLNDLEALVKAQSGPVLVRRAA